MLHWYLILLKRSLVFPILLFLLFLCTDPWGRLSRLSLLFLETLHSNGYIFSFLNAEFPWVDYTKWNKSDRESQTLYDITCRIWKSQICRNRIEWTLGLWAGWNGAMLVKEEKLPVRSWGSSGSATLTYPMNKWRKNEGHRNGSHSIIVLIHIVVLRVTRASVSGAWWLYKVDGCCFGVFGLNGQCN